MRAGTIFVVIAGLLAGVIITVGGIAGLYVYFVEPMVTGVSSSTVVSSSTTTFSTLPSHVTYDLTGPDEVRVGEPATFHVEVANTSATESHEIYSVDLYTSLTDQGDVEASPAPTTVNEDPGFSELVYEMRLPPGATEEFEVTLHPDVVGKYSVNIDLWLSDPWGSSEEYHDLEVLPAEP